MALKHRSWPSLLYAAGLVAVYLGERIVETGKASMVVALAGAAVVLVALGLRIAGERMAPAERRPVARMLVLVCGLGVLALAVHFLAGPLTPWLTGRSLAQDWPRLAGALGVLWPALLLCGTLPLVFVELALAGMARAPVLDSRRVRAALLSGLGIVFALVLCFAAAYVAAERNVKADLSYFRTARPGEATRKLVRALDKPVEVTLFFPPTSDAGDEVAGYFDDLGRESSQLAVTRLDHALEPARAKELGVSGNGMVVVARGAQREQLAIPERLESARGKLRTLDQEVHKRLILISRGPRTAYFVQGHDERGFAPAGETDKRATVRLMRDLLQNQGFVVKELGLAQGLGNQVPEDAALVLLLGPRRPLMPGESAALLRYLENKGRLLVALDPEGGNAADELLSGLALRYVPVTLANDRIHWARTRHSADRINIATGSYASHPSLAVLAPLGLRLPLVFLGAGQLERLDKPAPGAPTVELTIHADAQTWNDLDADFDYDPGKETRKAYELAAAVTARPAGAPAGGEGRAIVLADSDALSDELIINQANTVLALDAARWLGGDEKLAGVVNTEEDVPVRHTRKQDQVWFYGSVFAAPALVLGAGFLATRRRRRPGATKAQSPPTAAPKSEVAS